MAPHTPRPIAAEDVGAVAALEREIFGDPWSRRSFEEMLDLPHIGGFVVEDRAGSLAGYALCSSAGDEGEILNIAVASAHRRKGCGLLLLEACLDWLAERGADSVYLEVRESNAAAIAMYAERGFRTTGVRPKYYRKPTEDAVTMALALGRSAAGKR